MWRDYHQPVQGDSWNRGTQPTSYPWSQMQADGDLTWGNLGRWTLHVK